METIERFREAHSNGSSAHREFFKDAAEAFDYYACEQWPKADRASLQRQSRPALVFNQTNSIINVVSGSEVTNRYETRYLPRTLDDQEFNDMLTDTSRYIRQKCDAESEESAAFRDCVICGLGWTETSYDPFDGRSGKIRIERVPPFEVLYDPYARRPNLADARWIMRGKWVTRDEFVRVWGEENFERVKSAAEEAGMAAGRSEIHNQSIADLYVQNKVYYDNKKNRVPVWDFQEKELSRKYLVETYSIEGDMVVEELELSVSEFNRWKQDRDENSYTAVAYPTYVYRRSFIGGNVVLEEGESQISDFTLKAMTGFSHQKEGGMVRFFGLMKIIKDPQDWVNKMLSQLIHIVSTNPKGAILVEEGVFKNAEKARQDWAKPNPIIVARPNALQNKQIQMVSGKYPASIERIMQICIDFIPQLAGVNPYLTGQVEDLRRTAGAAVTSIQRQGLITLSVLFDSLRRYRKEEGVGGLIPKFIKEYMEEGEIIRITQVAGDLQGETVEFKKEWVEGIEYDVVVDEAPTSQTASQEFWNSLIQTDSLSILMEAGLLTPDIIADIMPNIPTTIRQRMKQNYNNLLQQAQTQEAAGMVPAEEGVIQ